MNQMWIRYDPDKGTIFSIGPLRDDNELGVHSPIDYFTAIEFIEEKKHIRDWIAVPDPLNPDLAKLINTKEEQMDIDISKSIYQIKKTTQDTDADFTVEQHNDKWIIKMKENLVNVLKGNDFYKEKVYNFYITNEDDPNILLDSFAINMKDLIEGELEVTDIDRTVSSRKDVSIFAYRLFDTYQHLIRV